MKEIDLIGAITDEINKMLDPVVQRLEDDVDIYQLMKAWNRSEAQVRRMMKQYAKLGKDNTFDLLLVYDSNSKHKVLVLRRKPVKEVLNREQLDA